MFPFAKLEGDSYGQADFTSDRKMKYFTVEGRFLKNERWVRWKHLCNLLESQGMWWTVSRQTRWEREWSQQEVWPFPCREYWSPRDSIVCFCFPALWREKPLLHAWAPWYTLLLQARSSWAKALWLGARSWHHLSSSYHDLLRHFVIAAGSWHILPVHC